MVRNFLGGVEKTPGFPTVFWGFREKPGFWRLVGYQSLKKLEQSWGC